jgi:DNA-binding GntR family transcriptional regulator
MTTDDRTPKRHLADRLRADIDAGRLQTGQQLPSIRELAEQHGVATGTVSGALQILRDDGLVSTIDKKGTYVTGAPGSAPLTLERVAELVGDLAARMEAVEAAIRNGSHGENSS